MDWYSPCIQNESYGLALRNFVEDFSSIGHIWFFIFYLFLPSLWKNFITVYSPLIAVHTCNVLQQLPQLLQLLKFWKTMDWLLRRVRFLAFLTFQTRMFTCVPFTNLHQIYRDCNLNCWYQGWLKRKTCPEG